MKELIGKLIFDRFCSVCINDNSFRRTRSSMNPLLVFVSATVNDHFVVINCSTPERVSHHKLDWYFQRRTSPKPPRVIWQRGRSMIHRYIAYSPDQLRHFLQIKPIHSNDSGTYTCLDQTTGFSARVGLIVRKCSLDFPSKSIICLRF